MEPSAKKPVLMIGYTNYQTDGRVIREAEAAVGAGYEVDFLALRRGNEPEVEEVRGVRVIHLNQRRYRGKGVVSYFLSYLEFFVRCGVRASWLFLKRRYGVIHVNNMPDFLVFCTFIPKLLGAKVVLDIHDPMPNTFASKFKKADGSLFFKLLLWQELASARYADRVITVHEPVKEFVLAKHGMNTASVEVIANFADEELFPVRESYTVEGKLRLVFHGTILERYGFRNLMQALAKVRHRDKIAVRIIGEGDFSKPLSELISLLRLQDMVQFENHTTPFHKIAELIQGSNVGLVPLEISSITNYALPLKLLEYVSLGLPVITVRSAAIGHYFGENDCLYYRGEEPESLRALLDELAENPSILLEYRKRVLRLREKFFWGKEKEKYVALLGDLCRERAEAKCAAAKT